MTSIDMFLFLCLPEVAVFSSAWPCSWMDGQKGGHQGGAATAKEPRSCASQADYPARWLTRCVLLNSLKELWP